MDLNDLELDSSFSSDEDGDTIIDLCNPLEISRSSSKHEEKKERIPYVNLIRRGADALPVIDDNLSDALMESDSNRQLPPSGGKNFPIYVDGQMWQNEMLEHADDDKNSPMSFTPVQLGKR